MSQNVKFKSAAGQVLTGRLDMPKAGRAHAMALFAHCFSCSKDIAAARVIARELAAQGIGVLRFDFTGLGDSEGAFADTNFSTNLEDIEAAAQWLGENFGGPDLLIGHSLGGAAMVAVAGRLHTVKAVATIGAPSDAGHVIHAFGSKLEDINANGEAEVLLAGRPFTIKQQFVEDVSGAKVIDAVRTLGRPLLVLHAPTDQTVSIENASGLFVNAKHPKSFVSLDTADHLLSRSADARYAARIIANWASRFLPEPADADETDARVQPGMLVAETGNGTYENQVTTGRHSFLADEPAAVGGDDSGPGPYDFLNAALGTCTSMTLRMYANRKSWPVERISVEVSHAKVVGDTPGSKVDVFERTILIEGDLDEAQRSRMLEIADKCPVHRTLEGDVEVQTQLA